MKRTVFIALAALASAAHADDATITKRLKDLGIKNIEITDSPVPGLRAVVTDKGLFYASKDGRYYLQGALVELKDNGKMVDLSNQPLMGRLDAVKSEAVVFPAKNEKYVVTAFFDSSCFYCKKMHKEIKDYNDRGITVRYLAFPRNGLNSKAARQMETVLNADDKAQAMHDLENGKSVKESKVNKVAGHYQLGLQFGVQGTPSIIFPDGTMHGGYINAQTMLELLQEQDGFYIYMCVCVYKKKITLRRMRLNGIEDLIYEYTSPA